MHAEFHLRNGIGKSAAFPGEVYLVQYLSLTPIKVTAGEWWYVEDRHGNRGYVPHTYLKTYPHSTAAAAAATATGGGEGGSAGPDNEDSAVTAAVAADSGGGVTEAAVDGTEEKEK